MNLKQKITTIEDVPQFYLSPDIKDLYAGMMTEDLLGLVAYIAQDNSPLTLSNAEQLLAVTVALRLRVYELTREEANKTVEQGLAFYLRAKEMLFLETSTTTSEPLPVNVQIFQAARTIIRIISNKHVENILNVETLKDLITNIFARIVLDLITAIEEGYEITIDTVSDYFWARMQYCKITGDESPIIDEVFNTYLKLQVKFHKEGIDENEIRIINALKEIFDYGETLT